MESGSEKDIQILITTLKKYIDIINKSDEFSKEVNRCKTQCKELIKIAETLNGKLENESK